MLVAMADSQKMFMLSRIWWQELPETMADSQKMLNRISQHMDTCLKHSQGIVKSQCQWGSSANSSV